MSSSFNTLTIDDQHSAIIKYLSNASFNDRTTRAIVTSFYGKEATKDEILEMEMTLHCMKQLNLINKVPDSMRKNIHWHIPAITTISLPIRGTVS